MAHFLRKYGSWLTAFPLFCCSTAEPTGAEAGTGGSSAAAEVPVGGMPSWATGGSPGPAEPSGVGGAAHFNPGEATGGLISTGGGEQLTVPMAGGGGSTAVEGAGGSQASGVGGQDGSDQGSGGQVQSGNAFEGRELFLLFGQSNMAGSAPIEAQDREENSRVKVLGMYDCPEIQRVYNEWSVAVPPLHACASELGPADYFAKGLAEAWPDSEIGLIPAAVPGVEIDFFRKGMTSREDQSYKVLPKDWDIAYDMIVEKSLLAMESGRIRGILFHQGESDSGQAQWVGKVAEIVADLRLDLNLGEDVPFIVGELPPTGCCGSHNSLIHQLPDNIPGTFVVSAEGLSIYDQYHFDSPSVRIFGQRYADVFLQAIEAEALGEP